MIKGQRVRLPSCFACWAMLVMTFSLQASAQDEETRKSVRERYTKYEYEIPMRDGVKLFTAIYAPKDTSKNYPFLLTRTPYSVSPYGVDKYRTSLGPSKHFEDAGYIFVYQDARGRYMSEGEFQQVRPYVPEKRGPHDVDESTDAYDTIEWLLENVPNHNGKAGMVGVSQPGFHVAASIIDTHPALKCASPQAPTADYYMGDDVYHNGAFMLAANFRFYSGFQPRGDEPEPRKPRLRFDPGTPDGYDFFLKLGPLTEVNERIFGGKAAYFQEIVDHPTYDEYWQRRSLWKFMGNVTCAVLNVGGWFDAEDPVGAFHIYHALEKTDPERVNVLVMGPWSHGGWGRGDGAELGNVDFHVKTGEFFREQIQFPFFEHYLKGEPADLPEAYMFLTGLNEWRRLDEWPPKDVEPLSLYFHARGRLKAAAPSAEGPDAYDEYISDPNRPVPFVGYIAPGMTRDYMTEDQRFASQRPDVLVYETKVLADDLTIAGPIRVRLNVSTTGTDSDWVVKVIDVYPGDYPTPDPPEGQRLPPNAVKMGGYQQLVRGEPFRGKYRNGFERGEPMVPGQPTAIDFQLPAVFHTFRKGHRIMVHVQSSWFPLVDRNPQQFMVIPNAGREAFQKATQRVYRSKNLSSSVTVLVEGRSLSLVGDAASQ